MPCGHLRSPFGAWARHGEILLKLTQPRCCPEPTRKHLVRLEPAEHALFGDDLESKTWLVGLDVSVLV